MDETQDKFILTTKITDFNGDGDIQKISVQMYGKMPEEAVVILYGLKHLHQTIKSFEMTNCLLTNL